MYFKQGRFLFTRQTRRATHRILCLLALGMMCAFSSAPTALAASVNGPSQTPTVPSNTTGGQPALGNAWQPFKANGADAKAGQVVPGRVLLQLAPGTTVTSSGGHSPKTSSIALNKTLDSLHATKLRQLGGNLVLVEIGSTEGPATAVARLATVPGVARVELDRYVTGMSTPPTPLPTSLIDTAAKQASAFKRTAVSGATLPSNYGLTSSLESWLNAGGVNTMGAYQQLMGRYGQLPGTGEIVTNVSIGDLTDQSMADAGDGYVQYYGPTTIISNGQRYLDLPSLPLIPTWTADASGTLNPTGSIKNQDPSDGEIMLDFGVMAPLPHDKQRPTAIGSGLTDLLGIAPGASYRLIVPTEPTVDQIATALLAAARQTPRPTVINASLGFGTDVNGFASRYFEDDPLIQSTIYTIVHQYGITVTIAANDGTRLFTPASVGPDGGSTPTDVTRIPAQTTNINDDATSTTPSIVEDSGAIAAGGTTTDDTLATGPAGSATVVETRISGGGNFSSGFGSRIDLSAPSDNIIAFVHRQRGTAQSVSVVLTGGTSASAPEIAAAAAVIHQVGLLTGHQLTPKQIRSLLERTGRRVTTPPQIDRTLQVGPQIDLTAAVESLLPQTQGSQNPQVVRLSVAHRQNIGGLGGTFIEFTDQNAIDLSGPLNQRGTATGEGFVGPVTFAVDLVGSQPGDDYQLVVGSTRFRSATPSIRVTPTQLLTAAGLPVVATGDRSLTVTFKVLRDDHTVASITRTLTLSASDGTFTEAPAPTVAPVVHAGQDVTVHYDLSGVRNVQAPRLAVSTVGHWNPVLAPLFNAAWSTSLTATSGTVTIPASAFATGGGLYGVGLIQNDNNPNYPLYGEFAPLRVAGFDATARPTTPIVSAPGQAPGHQVVVTHAAPTFTLHYSVTEIRGAGGSMLEVSAPAPTIYNSLNTFTAQNGTARDSDGYDSGSVIYQRLPGTSGTVQLNALKLGLASSLQYNLRVLPVDEHGQVVGQASPSSALVFNDGLAPDGGTVLDFASAGPDSIAVVTSVSGTSVLRYDPATGNYGATVTSDTVPTARYAVIGVDTGLHRVLVAHWTSNDTKQLETWDLITNTEVGKPITLTSSQDVLLGGRVDPVRHRAALLVWAQSDNANEVLPLDLTTSSLGTTIQLHSPAGASANYYNVLDLDQSTGHVQVAHVGSSLICFGGGTAQVLDVNLDSSQVNASASSTSRCGLAFADDQQGGSGWLLLHTSFSVNIPGTASLQQIDEQTLVGGQNFTLRKEFPQTIAVDGVHHLALIAYYTPAGDSIFGSPTPRITDSNAMSQLDLVDLTTGTVLRTLSIFNFADGFSNPLASRSERGIQLDPSTRTGWTLAPGHTQIQTFTY